jgi:hypothetical protein
MPSDNKSPTMPQVGDGATICILTSRIAATVVGATKSTITVQRDFALRTDRNGMTGTQSYVYHPNIHGTKHVFRRTKDGWKSNLLGLAYPGLILGVRDHFHDFGS